MQQDMNSQGRRSLFSSERWGGGGRRKARGLKTSGAGASLQRGLGASPLQENLFKSRGLEMVFLTFSMVQFLRKSTQWMNYKMTGTFGAFTTIYFEGIVSLIHLSQPSMIYHGLSTPPSLVQFGTCMAKARRSKPSRATAVRNAIRPAVLSSCADFNSACRTE